MTRHGEKIAEYPVRGSVNTGISYPLRFEGLRACVAAGLDLERWYNGGYDAKFQAFVVAWYRADGEVRRHSEDAVSEAVRKQMKRQQTRG